MAFTTTLKLVKCLQLIRRLRFQQAVRRSYSQLKLRVELHGLQFFKRLPILCVQTTHRCESIDGALGRTDNTLRLVGRRSVNRSLSKTIQVEPLTDVQRHAIGSSTGKHGTEFDRRFRVYEPAVPTECKVTK